MNCGSCRKENTAGANFCSSCGVALNEEATNRESETQRPSVSQLFIVVIIGVAVFGLGGGWFKNESSTQQAQQVTVPVHLSELALICRTAEQVSQTLKTTVFRIWMTVQSTRQKNQYA